MWLGAFLSIGRTSGIANKTFLNFEENRQQLKMASSSKVFYQSKYKNFTILIQILVISLFWAWLCQFQSKDKVGKV